MNTLHSLKHEVDWPTSKVRLDAHAFYVGGRLYVLAPTSYFACVKGLWCSNGSWVRRFVGIQSKIVDFPLYFANEKRKARPRYRSSVWSEGLSFVPGHHSSAIGIFCQNERENGNPHFELCVTLLYTVAPPITVDAFTLGCGWVCAAKSWFNETTATTCGYTSCYALLAADMKMCRCKHLAAHFENIVINCKKPTKLTTLIAVVDHSIFIQEALMILFKRSNDFVFGCCDDQNILGNE